MQQGSASSLAQLLIVLRIDLAETADWLMRTVTSLLDWKRCDLDGYTRSPLYAWNMYGES